MSAERDLRAHYTAELEQLRLQVEVMAVKVEQNVELMRVAISDPSVELGARAAATDVEIDRMNVSLTDRCYTLIARQSPVASDLRLIVSVVRVLNELERISDHAVRVCQEATGADLGEEPSQLRDLLHTLCEEVAARFHLCLEAWGGMDLDVAEELAGGSRLVDALSARLVQELVRMDGTEAVRRALHASSMTRSLERICDHTTVIGARVRYLITGNPAHLAAELR